MNRSHFLPFIETYQHSISKSAHYWRLSNNHHPSRAASVVWAKRSVPTRHTQQTSRAGDVFDNGISRNIITSHAYRQAGRRLTAWAQKHTHPCENLCPVIPAEQAPDRDPEAGIQKYQPPGHRRSPV